MASSSWMTCTSCNGKIHESDEFIISNSGKLLCKSCDGVKLVNSIHVYPLLLCTYHKKCKKRAILRCSLTDIYYCQACHNKHCESDQDDPQCSPDSLFHGSLCSSCHSPSLFFNTATSQYSCIDCIKDTSNDMESLVDIEIKKLHEKIESLLLSCKTQKYAHSSIIKKMRENITKMTAIMKTTGGVDNELNSAFTFNEERLNINIERNIQLDAIINNFSIESNVIDILVQALKERRVNIDHVAEYLTSIEKTVNDEFFVLKTVNKLKHTVEEVELVASQPTDMTISCNNEIDKHVDDPNLHEMISSQDSPGPVIENCYHEVNSTELVYHRGPFWLVFLDPNLTAKRNENIEALLQYKGNQLHEKSIKQGAHVIVKEDPRFGSKFKRGLITRHGYKPGTWCVTLLDYGKSLQISPKNIYEIPSSMDRQEATYFIGQLMKVRPVSSFAFTTVGTPNAMSIIKDRLLPSDRMAKLTIKYKVGELTFCEVKSNVQGREIDWSEALINYRVALPYHENMSCFIPDKQYCYFYHILNQCNSDTCLRSHHCPYCKMAKHRVVKCSAYIEAEVNLLKTHSEE